MGLIGGMARTAVVAGTATAVSNRVSRRQANRWSQQEQYDDYQQQQQYAQYQQPAPAPAAPAAAPSEDRYAKLKEVAELHSAGVLSDAEFEVEKARILQS
jgi:hypothetical protein